MLKEYKQFQVHVMFDVIWIKLNFKSERLVKQQQHKIENLDVNDGFSNPVCWN